MHGFRARLALPLRSICNSICHQPHGGETLPSQFESARKLTTTSRGLSAGSIQMEIVKALRSGDRRKASDLLLDFGRGSHSLTADDFLHIFKHCARSPDPLFAMEIWRLMEVKGISLNNWCFVFMMQALLQEGYFEEAFNMMDFVGESQSLYPTVGLYNIFLKSCTKIKSMFHASKCLDSMEKQMIGKNQVTYIELLKLAVLQKNLPAVHLIWEQYIKHYSMSIIPLRKFVWSFSRLGDLKSAYETLQQMVLLTKRENVSIARTKYGKFFSTRLDIPVPSNRELGSTMLDLKENKQLDSCIYPCLKDSPDVIYGNIEQQVTLMGNKEAKSAELDGLNGKKHSFHMTVLRWSFNDVLYACAQRKNYKLARKVFLQLQNLGLQPSRYTYDGFARAIVSGRCFRHGMVVLQRMQQKNLKPHDSTLAALSVGCSRALQLDLAEALLSQIAVHLYPYPYNALLEACDIMNRPERAVQVLAKMKRIKLVPDVRTYELLFSLFGLVNAPYEAGNMQSQVDAAKRINVIEWDMAKHGIQHSHISMKNMLKALGEEGMMRELVQYLHVAENLFIYQNPSSGTDIYNIVLHYLVEANESHMAIEIFKKMRKFGFHADSATYNIMIDCCSILRCYKSACIMVSMMIREGFYPVTCTYTALIKILLEDLNFSEALNLLERVRSSGIQLDLLLFNTFLRISSLKGRIDIVELIVEYMCQEKIQPDPATCAYVFSAYVNSGFHSTAIEALQVLSLRMMSEDGNILREKKEYVDKFILAEDSTVESEILILFENSKEQLSAGLLNLRWCAIAGFPICESADESPWAKRLELQCTKMFGPCSVRQKELVSPSYHDTQLP